MMFIIAKKSDWEAARQKGYYEVASLQEEGFLHCSKKEQVAATANRIFKGQQGLVLLEIDRAKVRADIREENPKDAQNLYPHIYGRLNLDAVVTVHPFPPKADGTFELPKSLSKPAAAKNTGFKNAG